MTAAAAVVVSLVLITPPAAADTAPPVAGTPPTVSTDVLPSVQIDGVVWDQEIAGNTVFAGGDFQTARPAGADPGVNTVTRRYLLSYNLQSGALNSAWNPNPNARIRNMALSPDGSRLYVVGSFTSIAGATRYRIAAFDTATGALTSFKPVLNGKVNAVAATNSTVYLVGQFTVADGAAVSGAAAYDAVTGARKTAWVPQVTDGQAIAVTVKSDGSRVVIGGYFTKVNGSSNPGYGLAMLDGSTAAMLPFNVNNKVRNAGANAAISSLASDANGVYGTGQHYGTGTLEGTFYATWTNGDIIWVEDCHGDTYSVYPAADVVYTTSHAHYCGNIGGFPQTNPWGLHRGLAFTKTVQGTITKDPLGYTNWAGTPRPALLHWFPDINAGTFTGLSQGGWSVAGNSQYILYGGEFTQVDGVKQQGIVRFAVSSIAANKDAPRLSGANYVPTVTSPAARTAKVTWKANWDRDNTRLTYAVIRNGNTATPVYSTISNSNFWTMPSMSFTDVNLTPGATYNYRIRVTDPFGNAVTGNPVSVAVSGAAAKLQAPTEPPASETPTPTPIPAPTADPYAASVLRDSPADYWRLGDAVGPTVLDRATSSSSEATDGVTFGVDGAIVSDTAASFDGKAGSVTSVAGAAGASFAVEAWFSTTSASGGAIVGFAGATPGSADRRLSIDGTGGVLFTIGSTAGPSVRSAAGFNDGKWHHVVGNVGSTGLELFVDGSLAATTSGEPTSVSSGQGNWRIGADPAADTGAHFAGSIDEVAVYAVPLTATQVRDHYVASGR